MRPADQLLDEMARRLAPDLLAYFLRRVDDPADAADLLQETLLVLCRRPRAIPQEVQEQRLWAYGVARRVLSTHRRSRRRRSDLVERLRGELAAAQEAPATPELHAALARLDPEDREIVRLVHWEGLTQAEVARVLGHPAGTIRSRYLRSRQRLREFLADTVDAVVH